MATAIPSLHNGPVDILTNKQKQLWSIIAFVFNNPGNISNVMESEMVSFRKLDAEFGLNRDQMASEFEKSLGEIIDRVFPDGNISVSVVAEPVDEVRYTLRIAISEGTEVILATPIDIDNQKVTITNWNTVI